MEELKIITPAIKLDQLVKYAGFSETGAKAKILIDLGEFNVNAEKKSNPVTLSNLKIKNTRLFLMKKVRLLPLQRKTAKKNKCILRRSLYKISEISARRSLNLIRI